MNDRIMRIAKTLDITYDEAKAMIEEDKKIDRMTKSADINNDLNDNQKKAIKKYTNVARGKAVDSVDAYGKKTKRTIKVDDAKRELIAMIAEMLNNSDIISNVDVTNPQKIIAFKMGDDDFEIDLKRKRKPKA